MNRLFAGALLLCGCLAANQSFRCTLDSDCDVAAGEKCFANACAAPATYCPGGYQWTATAPLKGQCVELDMAMEIPDLIRLPDLSTCGNGTIDPGEECDPAIAKNQPGACPDCDDHNPCTKDITGGCVDHCSYKPVTEGMSCGGGDGGVTGTCHGFGCCIGCWNGSACIGGGATEMCGMSGGACTNCNNKVPDGGVSECYNSDCVNNVDAGACSNLPVTNGKQCMGNTGTCQMGKCCTGCVDNGGKCLPGNTQSACGSAGNKCQACQTACAVMNGGNQCLDCIPNPTCNGRQCDTDSCGVICGTCDALHTCNLGTYQCDCNYPPGGESDDVLCANGIDDDCDKQIDCADSDCATLRCSGGSGKFCDQGMCKNGCVISGTFYVTNATNPNNANERCSPLMNDSDWTCTGCYNNGVCDPGNVASACGKNGVICASCLSPTCHTATCSNGQCGLMAASDGTLCGPAPGDDCGLGLDCMVLSCAKPAVCVRAHVCQGGSCKSHIPVKCCNAIGETCGTMGSGGAKDCVPL